MKRASFLVAAVVSLTLLTGCSTSHSFDANKTDAVDRSDRNVQRMRPGEVDQTAYLPNASGVIGGKTGLTYAESGVQNIFMFDDGGLWTKSGQDVVLKGLDITLDPTAREEGGPLFAGATRVQIAEASATASTVNPTLAAYIKEAAAAIMRLSDNQRDMYIKQLETMGEFGQSIIGAVKAALSGGASTVVEGITQ